MSPIPEQEQKIGNLPSQQRVTRINREATDEMP